MPKHHRKSRSKTQFNDISSAAFSGSVDQHLLPPIPRAFLNIFRLRRSRSSSRNTVIVKIIYAFSYWIKGGRNEKIFPLPLKRRGRSESSFLLLRGTCTGFQYIVLHLAPDLARRRRNFCRICLKLQYKRYKRVAKGAKFPGSLAPP